jgi:hypothetical protein
MRSCPVEGGRKKKKATVRAEGCKKFYVDILRALTERIFLYHYRQVARKQLFNHGLRGTPERERAGKEQRERASRQRTETEREN